MIDQTSSHYVRQVFGLIMLAYYDRVITTW